jgi:hypothetical protein
MSMTKCFAVKDNISLTKIAERYSRDNQKKPQTAPEGADNEPTFEF